MRCLWIVLVLIGFTGSVNAQDICINLGINNRFEKAEPPVQLLSIPSTPQKIELSMQLFFDPGLALLPSVLEGQDATTVPPPRMDGQRIRIHRIESPYQRGSTKLKVLLPEKLDESQRYPIVYVLPVEAGEESRYGDGLAEVMKQ